MRNFESERHALTAGMVLGMLMGSGLDAAPEVDDDRDYTDVIRIAYEGSNYRVRVLP